VAQLNFNCSLGALVRGGAALLPEVVLEKVVSSFPARWAEFSRNCSSARCKQRQSPLPIESQLRGSLGDRLQRVVPLSGVIAAR